MEAFFKPTSEVSSQGALVLKLKIANEFKVKKKKSTVFAFAFQDTFILKSVSTKCENEPLQIENR